MIQLILMILKILGTLLTGALGLVGVLWNFRDASGDLTKRGKLAAWAIGFSGLVALGSSIIEETIKIKDALDGIARSEKLLKEIHRAVHPLTLKDLRLGFSVRVPMDHIRVKSEGYKARFTKEMGQIVKRLEMPGASEGGIIDVMRDQGDNPKLIEFDRSPLVPGMDEKLSRTILGKISIELHLFNPPIAVKEHPRISGKTDRAPDLALVFSSGLGSHVPPAVHSIEYNVRAADFGKAFRVRGKMIPLDTDDELLKNTGKIVSFADLAGSQLFVFFHSPKKAADPDLAESVAKIRKRFELDTLVISMSSGREFFLEAKSLEPYQFQAHQDKDGFPIFEFNFPKSEEKLSRMGRN